MRQIIFPKLTKWQQDVYTALDNSRGTGKVFIVKAKRQVGKSILAAIELIKFAIEKPCISIIIEPTLTQSRRVFKDIQHWIEQSGLVESFNTSLLEIKFNNGSEIIFKSAEQRDRLRGYTVNGLLVIDEAAFIPDEVIDIVFPWVDANNAPVLLISTPLFKSGRFYNLYSTKTNKSYSFDWSKYDTSQFLPSDKLEYYRQTISPIKFASEYLGEFITDGSYVFKHILDCITTPIDTKPTYIGVDWGTGQNGDYTALIALNSNKEIVKVLKVNNLDPTEQVISIADYINNNPSIKLVLVEKNSIGSIFYDMLKNKLYRKSILNAFNTTNDSKRAIIEDLSSAFEQRSISILDDSELITELQHYAVEKTKTGKITYNGIFGYHDDLVIALSLAFHCTKAKSSYRILMK